MVIRASSGRQIDGLVADLRSDEASTREAAIARLTVIGARAVDQLIQVARPGQPPDARAAALRALDAIGDPRSLPTARHAASDPEASVATAAMALLRGFLLGPSGVETLDVLAGIALDRTRADAVRGAAIQALGDLPAATLEPIWAMLRADPSDVLAAQVPAPGDSTVRAVRAEDVLGRAAHGELPDTPDTLRRALAHAGHEAPLTALQQIVEHVHEREATEPEPRRTEWRVARGAAHALLAERDSRLALYDLKESLASADTPLPVEFLAALGRVGDVGCLESVAGAYARATSAGGGQPDWWRTHLADAFRTIVKRERLTRRHAALKRVAERWPGSLSKLLT